MKKLFTTFALCALAFASSYAKDVQVIVDGKLQSGFVNYAWWNPETTFEAANPLGEGKVMTVKQGSQGPNYSTGIHTDGFITGPLHSATLNFEWYCPDAGNKFTIRLKGATDANYDFTVAADQAGKWNTTNLSIAEFYPVTSKEWNEFVGNGSGVVFSVVSEGNPEGNTISFKNVFYSNIDENWKEPVKADLPVPTSVPVPTQDANDVKSLFSKSYEAATTFNIGGWGQSTKSEIVEIAGTPVYKLSNFNYVGWEFANHIDVSDCNRVHVDVFPTTGKYMGFTPISPGNELTKGCDLTPGEWNSLDVDLNYFEKVVMTDLFQFKFDGGNGDPYYIGNVYFYRNGTSVDSLGAEEVAPVYFNLQGQKVATPSEGQILIRVANGKSTKVRF